MQARDLAKRITTKMETYCPAPVSMYMFESLVNLDMLIMRPCLVRRGGLEFSVGKSILYGKFWSKIAWEEETYRIMRSFLSSNKSYIDIGAWVGPTALYGMQLAKHTYAIEPDPIAVRYLRRNIDMNPSLKERITVVESCIDEVDGTVRLGVSQFPGDSESSSLLDSNRILLDVNSIRFDTLVREHEIDDCNFIKMDIEGGEFHVLPTMHRFLQDVKPTLCLSVHPQLSRNLVKDLNGIAEVLQEYQYVFSGDGSAVDLESLRDGIPPRSSQIIASDEMCRRNLGHTTATRA